MDGTDAVLSILEENPSEAAFSVENGAEVHLLGQQPLNNHSEL